MSDKHFEDFHQENAGGDLFDRAAALDAYLAENPEQMLDGLGLVSLDAAQPEMRLHDGETDRRTIMLGSNSYLNLTTHPDVVKASVEATHKYGYGTGAVSLYAGISELHRELEETIARFYGVDDAILFPSGYGMNVGVLSALCRPGDVIVNDSANHASIFDGSVLSGARLKVFPHRRMDRLEHVLKQLPDDRASRLIVTDGVFSMHGDLAPLDEIVALARKYGARVMVDDAHGIGVVGPTGRGTAEAFGVMRDIDLHASPLTKAPGGLGGFCAGRKDVVQYLRLYARPYFFSTALPVPVVAGLLEVFKLLEADAAGRATLRENVRFLKTALGAAGFNMGDADSGIIPLIVGDERKLAAFHRELVVHGVYTNIVTYPAVRRKEARVRLCVMSTLSKEQMERAVEIIVAVGKQCQVI